MNRAKIYLGQIALLMVVGILGFLWGRGSRVEMSKLEILSVSAKAGKAKTPVEKRDASIDPPSVVPVADEFKSTQRVARLQAVTDLNRLLTRKISVPMILGEDLNKDFVALFGLSIVEVKILNDAIAKVKTQIAELESIHAQIEPKGSEKFIVTIPIFPKEGGLVLDEFMNTVRSTIGDERYAYYNNLSRFDAENNSAFGMFGLSQTVINIEEMRGPNGMPTANSSMGFDQESGGMIKTVNTGLHFLKVQYPAIYRKLVDSGAITPGSK